MAEMQKVGASQRRRVRVLGEKPRLGRREARDFGIRRREHHVVPRLQVALPGRLVSRHHRLGQLEPQLTTVRHSVPRVADQVDQDLLELTGIDFDEGTPRAVDEDELDGIVKSFAEQFVRSDGTHGINVTPEDQPEATTTVVDSDVTLPEEDIARGEEH